MENKHTNSNIIDKFAKVVRENRRIVLCINIMFSIVTFLIVIGLFKIKSEIIVELAKDLFVTSLFTAITLVITWGEENERDEIIDLLKTENNKLKTSELDVHKLVNTFLSRDCRFCKSYFLDIYPNREQADLKVFFRRAKKRLYILTTNLDSVSDCATIISKKAKDGVDVKICTLDPTCPSGKEFIKTRELSTGIILPGDLLNSMRSSLYSMIKTFKKVGVYSDDGDNVFIKTYSVPPSTILFISDDECIMAFMLDERKSRETIHLHFRINEANSEIYCFKTHFDCVFKDAKYADENVVRNWSL